MSKEETIRGIWADQPPYTTPMKLMSEAYDAALSQSAARIAELEADLTLSRNDQGRIWEYCKWIRGRAFSGKGLLQEAFTMIRMLRSFIACGESTTKDDDAAIASILDKLRIAVELK